MRSQGITAGYGNKKLELEFTPLSTYLKVCITPKARRVNVIFTVGDVKFLLNRSCPGCETYLDLFAPPWATNVETSCNDFEKTDKVCGERTLLGKALRCSITDTRCSAELGMPPDSRKRCSMCWTSPHHFRWILWRTYLALWRPPFLGRKYWWRRRAVTCEIRWWTTVFRAWIKRPRWRDSTVLIYKGGVVGVHGRQ